MQVVIELAATNAIYIITSKDRCI